MLSLVLIFFTILGLMRIHRFLIRDMVYLWRKNEDYQNFKVSRINVGRELRQYLSDKVFDDRMMVIIRLVHLINQIRGARYV